MNNKKIVLNMAKTGFKILYYVKKDRVSFLEKKYPAETVNNFSMKISYIKENLRQILKENNIKTKKINLVISEDEDWIFYLTSKFPSVSEDELRKIIGWEMKKYIPEETITDYIILKKFEEASIKKYLTVFTGIGKKEFSALLYAFKKSGLMVLGVEPSFYTCYLAFKNLFQQKDPFLIVDIGSYMTSFIFIKNTEMLYARKINYGIEDITQQIVKELDINYQAAEVKNKIEQIIQERGKNFISIRSVLETLVKEINFSISYFTSLYPDEKIKNIFLAGDGAKIKGLEDYLTEEINLPVKIPEIKYSNSSIPSEFITTLGGIFEEKEIDFTGIIKEKKINPKPVLTLFFSCIFIGICLSILTNFYENRMKALAGKIHEQTNVFPVKNLSYPNVFLMLGEKIPDDVVLENVSIANENIDIYGSCMSESSLNEFLNALTASSSFKYIELSSSDMKDNMIKFHLSGVMK